MKAADSETATDKTKVTAHGLLVFWYCDASITETVPIHFIYAACQHANLAALFCERVSPHDFSSSPAVIWLLDSVIGVNPAEDLPQDMPFMYPEMFEVDDERQERTCELDEVFLQKKRNHSHEYFCDADDCDIQTEFPDTLFKCTSPATNRECTLSIAKVMEHAMKTRNQDTAVISAKRLLGPVTNHAAVPERHPT